MQCLFFQETFNDAPPLRIVTCDSLALRIFWHSCHAWLPKPGPLPAQQRYVKQLWSSSSDMQKWIF